jgi:hypothetical protein
MLPLLSLLWVFHLPQVKLFAVPDKQHSFLLSSPTLPYSEVRWVANDGNSVLAGYDLWHGYRLDRGYELVREYRFRVVFPTGARAAAAGKYKINNLEAVLEQHVALASLRKTSSTGFSYSSDTWAVFPIDRFMDPRPTDVIHLENRGRLLHASLSGARFAMTVAEDSGASKTKIVDYEFELAPRSAQGVFDARRVSRKVAGLGFSKERGDGGLPIDSFSLGPGKLSQDRRRLIHARTVNNLATGKDTAYRFDSKIEAHVELYFIGDDLYHTIRPSRTQPSKGNSPNVGIWKLGDGKWVKVSGLVLDAISANGMYAAVHMLPDDPLERAKRFVVKLR